MNSKLAYYALSTEILAGGLCLGGAWYSTGCSPEAAPLTIAGVSFLIVAQFVAYALFGRWRC